MDYLKKQENIHVHINILIEDGSLQTLPAPNNHRKQGVTLVSVPTSSPSTAVLQKGVRERAQLSN